MSNVGFSQRLLACDDSTSVVLPSGARFIRKLPGEAALAYLHVLHAPLSKPDLAKLRARLGDRLPPDYEAFLLFANGADLFANTLFLYGYAEKVSRGLALEDQGPISLLFESETFAATAGERWDEEWARIGSMVGWDRRWYIEAHRSGRCALLDETGGMSHFSSFENLMERAVGRLESCFSCDGLIDDSCQELEAAISSLIYPG